MTLIAAIVAAALAPPMPRATPVAMTAIDAKGVAKTIGRGRRSSDTKAGLQITPLFPDDEIYNKLLLQRTHAD